MCLEELAGYWIKVSSLPGVLIELNSLRASKAFVI